MIVIRLGNDFMENYMRRSDRCDMEGPLHDTRQHRLLAQFEAFEGANTVHWCRVQTFQFLYRPQVALAILPAWGYTFYIVCLAEAKLN